jgi:DNA-binding response OmpR family regulator
MKRKILIVESDSAVGSAVAELLKKKNYDCLVTDSALKTYKILEHLDFDLVLLENLLKDGDSMDLVEYLHETRFTTRIMLVTKLDNLKDRLVGLERGADDCIAKPFSYSELLIKVDKLLHKHKVLDESKLSCGPITLFPDQGMLYLNKSAQKIRKREMQILLLLIKHQNRVLSPDKLISQIWATKNSAPTKNTLDVYMRRLRIALGKYGNLLKTVRSYGYCLNSQLELAH